jgi:hypothetical protein
MKSRCPGDATFSPCMTWRYALTRTWVPELPPLVVVGLNPSTATAELDDRTIRKCIYFAMQWRYGGLVMLNIFAFRSRDPKVMRKAVDPIGPENDAYLLKLTEGRRVLCAWGTNGDFMERDRAVLKLLAGRDLVALRLSDEGFPWHPLYIPNDTKPIAYAGRP